MRICFLCFKYILGVGVIGCAQDVTPFDISEDNIGRDISADTDADTDMDTDSDTDSDIESEINEDTDTMDTFVTPDNGTDSDINTDTNAEANSSEGTDLDTDTVVDSNCDKNTNQNAETCADKSEETDEETDEENNTETDEDKYTETDEDKYTETDEDKNTETDTDLNAETDADTASDTDTDIAHPSPSDSATPSDTSVESCFDGEQNQDEEEIDCGGVCPSCPCKRFEYSMAEVVSIPGVSGEIFSPTLSDDGLTMYFSRYYRGDADIFVAVRESRDSLEFKATEVTAILTSILLDSIDGTPFISADGLALLFQSERFGGEDGRDIMISTRSNTTESFSTPKFMTGVNSDADEHQPWLSEDRLTMFFVSNREDPEFAGEDDNIWFITRASLDESFANAQYLEGVNTDAEEGRVALTNDLLILYFDTNGRGAIGGNDLFMATRADKGSDFGNIERLPDTVNSSADDRDVALSTDGTELFFSSDRGDGSARIWRSKRTCAEY